SERPAVLISETGALLGQMGSEGRVLNKPKGDGFSAGSWLENDGDSADQAQAAGRAGLDRKQGRMQLGDLHITYDLNKTLSADGFRELCRNADLAIAPQQDHVQCRAITRKSLRKSGSVAIWMQDGQLVLDTTNARRGPRIWTGQQ
ncbi:MAG: ComEC family competence protein, partial [Litoreibacter sp.]